MTEYNFKICWTILKITTAFSDYIFDVKNIINHKSINELKRELGVHKFGSDISKNIDSLEEYGILKVENRINGHPVQFKITKIGYEARESENNLKAIMSKPDKQKEKLELQIRLLKRIKQAGIGGISLVVLVQEFQIHFYLLQESAKIFSELGLIKSINAATKDNPNDELLVIKPKGEYIIEQENGLQDLYDEIKVNQTNEIIMGDKNEFINSQIGAVGSNALSNNNSFQQVIYNFPTNLDFDELRSQLTQLREHLASKAKLPEEFIAISEVAEAELASKNKDGNKVAKHLKGTGKWVFDTAKDIGVELVAELIKKQMEL